MGLGRLNRLLLGDEPGSWDRRSGALMYEALRGALGKVVGGRLLLIGTKSGGHGRRTRDCSAPGSHRMTSDMLVGPGSAKPLTRSGGRTERASQGYTG